MKKKLQPLVAEYLFKAVVIVDIIKVIEGLNGNDYFKDGELTSDKVIELSEMDCQGIEIDTFLCGEEVVS